MVNEYESVYTAYMSPIRIQILSIIGWRVCKRRLVSIDITHRNPDILDLYSVIQKLFTLTLFSIRPIAINAIVNPRPLHVVR